MHIKSNFLRYILILTCIFGLISVRMFENILFYDPLIEYFKGNFQHTKLPDFDTLKLFLHLIIRYFMNSILSLFLIYLVFKDVNLTKISSALYVIILPIVLFITYISLKNYNPEKYNMLFYSRRFLIQPILVLLFLAAFYYQKKLKPLDEIQ